MILLHRKTIFLIFGLISATLLFALVFFVFLNQPLIVRDSYFELLGRELVFNSVIVNTSNSDIENVEFALINGDLKTSELIDFIPGDGNVSVSVTMPLSDNLNYEVFVYAPFNKPFYFPFNLDKTVVNPVDINLNMSDSLVRGRDNDFTIDVCNVSNGDIIAIGLIIEMESGYFDKPILPTEIDLEKDKCKTLNYTLYPITAGEVNMSITIKVHELELYYEKNIVISG